MLADYVLCRLLFKLPRIVPGQKERYEADDMFKKVSRDSEVSQASL